MKNALPEFLESDAKLNDLVSRFEAGTWPIAQWTHAAHLTLATCYILDGHEPDGDDALDRLRAGIPRYNVSQGGENTEDHGYHETLTCFWHMIIQDYIAAQPGGLTRLEMARRVVGEFASQRDLFREYYDFDVVKSREARAKWIPPPDS